MQLEESKEVLQKNGLGIGAISYDSLEVLQKIATEKSLTIPLLSDQGSRIIRDFHILDTSVALDNPAYGVPLHGWYVVNEAGVIKSKLFVSNTGHWNGIVLTRPFASPLNTHEKVVKLDYGTLRYYASANAMVTGGMLDLTIEVALNDGVHIYASGAGDYSGLTWKMDTEAVSSVSSIEYPSPQLTNLPGKQEKALLYHGTFCLSQKMTISSENGKVARLVNRDGTLSLTGTLRYQACDEKICFLPQTIPLEWKIELTSP